MKLKMGKAKIICKKAKALKAGLELISTACQAN
jgi:hypothetical protein